MAKPVRCPYGCGRYVLPERMADHYLIAQVEHSVAKVQREVVEEAYALLCRISQEEEKA